MSQVTEAGEEQEVGTLVNTDYFGEIALLFDRWRMSYLRYKKVRSFFQA